MDFRLSHTHHRFLLKLHFQLRRLKIVARDGNWQAIIAKHGEAMWLKVKDKFEASGMRQHVLQALVVDTMQTLFRAWKTRLYADYSLYDTDEERLSHRPNDVTPEDWVFLVEHFGSPAFKAMSERNKLNRGKQTTKHSCGSKSFAEVEESTYKLLSIIRGAAPRNCGSTTI
nr:PREDICTED: uncharacterized protein LOC107804154 isoform X5 [Nicotiana tabacum]